MIILRLALRNLMGAGIGSWLNAIVLSFAFVSIIIFQGLYQGMDEQATKAKIESEYGGGQYWQKDYEVFDPLSLPAAHAAPPESLTRLIREKKATALLVTQGTIYTKGRALPVLMKGVDPGQTVLTLPSSFLESSADEIPALVGVRMAKAAWLKEGDTVTLQWRETGGSFNALDVRIVRVIDTTNAGIDSGQVWLPLEKLRSMTRMPDEANVVVLSREMKEFPEAAGWTYKSLGELLQDVKYLVQAKKMGSAILYVLLLLLAMLAIFDTQVLSIFRRRKEIGMLMALGMTRGAVIRLFTLEGALHSVLAAAVGVIYGFPLAVLLMTKGWTLPQVTDSLAFAIGEKIFPVYSAGLVAGTALLVFGITTVVSFLPARKISRLRPTDALKGKLS